MTSSAIRFSASAPSRVGFRSVYLDEQGRLCEIEEIAATIERNFQHFQLAEVTLEVARNVHVPVHSQVADGLQEVLEAEFLGRGIILALLLLRLCLLLLLKFFGCNAPRAALRCLANHAAHQLPCSRLGGGLSTYEI